AKGDVFRPVAVTLHAGEALEEARPAYDRRLLGMGKRYLDDLNPEQRRVGVLVGRALQTLRHLARGPDARRAGDVDVDVVLVVRADQHGVRVGAAARLDAGDVPGMGDVGDVEDPDTAHPRSAD